jgi:hypothetical protein
MARLLRVHFASIGHPDARLSPLTLDLRANDETGTGTDSVLWLRNGGGKSTILNLFYSLFRPDRREFLGTSAEGRARHLEDYVKAEDLSFVVTEWDVEPVMQDGLLAMPPARRRVVGQVLSWKDQQKSSDASRLRRRFFSLLGEGDFGLESLPIDGLSPQPVRSFEAFRSWLEELRQTRPELEPFWDDTPRKWLEHLEKIGLDPELFRYQLRMNAREGSADEAFRFRTTDEFVRFFLEVAFETAEADQVSANVELFRDKLTRRPALLAEQTFLIEARHHLVPLQEAQRAALAAQALRLEARREAAAVLTALHARAEHHRAVAESAKMEREGHHEAERRASNDADRLNRWANGLARRALELDLQEAQGAHEAARAALATAEEQVAVAEAAVARDTEHELRARRDAKSEALAAAQREQEPLRRQVQRAGTTLRARLAEAAELERGRSNDAAAAAEAARKRRDEHEARQVELEKTRATIEARIRQVDEWLAQRDAERELLRQAGAIELREDALEAFTRWEGRAEARRTEAASHRAERADARARALAASEEAKAHGMRVARLEAELQTESSRLDAARAERERLQGLGPLREVEGTETPDLDAPGTVDRLHAAADRLQRQILVTAVEGAEDDRALQSLDRIGRLPSSPDAERALGVLRSAELAAWLGTEYLVANVPEGEREALVRGDPALWHGLVVADEAALEKARALLATFAPRLPVTVAPARLAPRQALEERLVLPGHPAHWDERAGGRFRDELSGRRDRRERERDEQQHRERAFRAAAEAVARWRGEWGDGRLAVAESDVEQRVAARGRALAEHDAAVARGKEAMAQEREALRLLEDAERDLAASERTADRVRAFVERFDQHVDARRREKDQALGQRALIEDELASSRLARDGEDARWLAARDEAAAHLREAERLQQERDRVELSDEEPPEDRDLVGARAAWSDLYARWQRVVSENRLQWELDQLSKQLTTATAELRRLAKGREAALEAVPMGEGERRRASARKGRERATHACAQAELREQQARAQLPKAPRRREADDLPPEEPPPASAAAARARAEECRAAREVASQRMKELAQRAGEAEARHRASLTEAEGCIHRSKRLGDVLGDERPEVPGEILPDEAASVDHLVDVRVSAVKTSNEATERARREAARQAEALREVATSAAHEAHRSRVKERLKAPAHELADVADALHRDVEERLEVVRGTLAEIDQDRRLLLQEVDKVAMDGVKLLQAAERASKLPAGLGAWEGESFLRIRAEVPGSQPERQARLEPLLDRLVAKGQIPDGRELVNAAVQELASRRIEVTLLKPDAILRRERLPVTEMQTFSRGQQLTVAILLYCTLAQLRGQQRGRRGRVDGGVLLLDNPVGTCSSVPLLELQRQVARQMRVQLVYTTGVNDPDAVSTFPNTVRLRNNHRARASGDLHVTVESGIEGIRVVGT